MSGVVKRWVQERVEDVWGQILKRFSGRGKCPQQNLDGIQRTEVCRKKRPVGGRRYWRTREPRV